MFEWRLKLLTFEYHWVLCSHAESRLANQTEVGPFRQRAPGSKNVAHDRTSKSQDGDSTSANVPMWRTACKCTKEMSQYGKGGERL